MAAWTRDEATQVLELLPAPTVILDDARRLVVVNDAAREVLGVEEGAEVALPTRASADVSRTDQRHVLGAGGEPFLANVAWRGIELDGVAHTLVQVFPILGPAREKVLEARDLEVLQHGTAIAQLGIFEHDHLTEAIWISTEMRRIYGWELEKPATLTSFMEAAHPDDGPRVGAAIAQAHDPDGDGWCDVEGRLFRPNGEIRWIRTRSRTYFEGEGAERRPSRTIGAIVDLTEAKQLAEVRDRLTSVLDETPDLVAIVGGAGRIEYANPAARAFFSHPESLDQFPAESLVDHAADHAAALEELMDRAVPEALEKGRARVEITLANGRSLSVLLLVHRHRTGGVSHYSLTARDTTEIRAIEEQLRQSQKMEAIGKLAGGIAHDFNNVLSVILSCAELLQDDLPADHPSRRDVQEIEAGASRAAELTRQLLAFSRRQVLRPRTIDPAAVLVGIEPMLRRLVGEGVEIATMLGEPRANIRADPSQLEQVLLNLVVNARDALPHGGKITLETGMVHLDEVYVASHADAQVGPHVMLAVSDDGVGMDPATRDRIFEPFFTTKGPGRGTGLGLATVYGIVRQSGGNIWVYSEPGRGTTFKLYFPVEDSAAVQNRDRPPQPSSPAYGAGARILLVEDDPAVRRVTAQLLERSGYLITEAPGPTEALALGAEGISLLLTDVVMPKMTGRQLAERLTERYPQLRVLYMSGYTENSVVHHGVLEPGIEFLAKPIVPAKLLAAVEAALRKCE